MAVSVGFNLLLLSTLWGAEAGEFSQVSPGRLAWMGGLSLLMLPVIWASLAISVKRWHDRNKSGWWVLIALIPVVGGLWTLIENGFLAGSDGPNRYGEDPRSLR
jgi:uncharacterized membrane protein YhaH (DUF805 family)